MDAKSQCKDFRLSAIARGLAVDVIDMTRKHIDNKARRRLKKFAKMYKEGRITAGKIAASYQGSRNYILQGDTGAIIAKLDALFLDIFKEDKELNGLNIEQALRNLNKGGGQ